MKVVEFIVCCIKNLNMKYPAKFSFIFLWCIDIKLIDKDKEESMTLSPVHDVFKCNLHHEHIKITCSEYATAAFQKC